MGSMAISSTLTPTVADAAETQQRNHCAAPELQELQKDVCGVAEGWHDQDAGSKQAQHSVERNNGHLHKPCQPVSGVVLRLPTEHGGWPRQTCWVSTEYSKMYGVPGGR